MKNRHRRQGGKSAGKKPWLRRLAALLAVTGVVVWVLAGLAYAVPWAAGKACGSAAGLDVFAVNDVQVSGLKHVRRDDLVSYMGDPSGKSIFDVDVDGVVDRLGAHPWLKGVSVKRELPDRVVLMVEERNPAAVVVAAYGRFLSDKDGAVLSEVTTDDWNYLPSVVYEKAARPSAPGSAPEESLMLAAALIGPVRSDPTETLAGAVVYVGADGLPYLKLDGAVVTVGRGGYGDKVKRLAEIYGDVRKRGVSPRSIDLRFPGKVIVDGDREEEQVVVEDNS